MPLTQALAQQTENLAAAPVLEIYGSTDTGVLAMRRAAGETQWQPVDGVRLAPTDTVTRAWGSHFASPRMLPDQIDVDGSGRFTLLGRQADLIKIAGRRTSLAGLNLLLQELPGLEDGVFYLPATGSATERLCLIYSGPALDRLDVDQWLRARIDPVFLPRILIRVDRLPRSDNGKLPRQALDRLFEQRQAAERVPAPSEFVFAVPMDHPALEGHFPGRPIVPGVLLLDQVTTHIGTALNRPVALLRQVKFASALLPEETARVAFDTCGQRVDFSVSTLRDGLTVTLAKGNLSLAEPAPDR
jgi:3-hydroxymyristoyl/3-hydroxydecanoyl-(acyl carrier protein) dehydratase